MKKFTTLLLIILIFPFSFVFSGCSAESSVFVTDIVQTEVVGNNKTYTIYYSDGSTSLITVENGTNGIDGDDFTIEMLKEYSIEKGYTDFDKFLKDYFSFTYENNDIQKATNLAIQSAVTIWSEFPVSTYRGKTVDTSRGAGVIYKMDEDLENGYSYIITNYHVVYYTKSNTLNSIARKIIIYQYGGNEKATLTNTKDSFGYPEITYGEGAVEVDYVGGSMLYDLAVLKVKTSKLLEINDHTKPVSIASEYNIGETAIAIGNPEGEGFSVTSGIVSVLSEEIEMTGADDITPCTFRVMRIDTAVNGGNSGGGLFNNKGEWIGIVNAKAVSSDIDNIAYAIPFDNAIAVVENLLFYHNKGKDPAQVKNLVLNIEYSIVNNHAVYNPTTNTTTLYDDIKVETVALNGIGHLIGLQAGDIINKITINDVEHTLNRSYEFSDLLLTIRPGDRFIIEVTRNNITKELGIATEPGVLETYLTIVA